MRRFLLVSRTGRTDAKGASMRDAGYLDVVHQCGVMALFKSHGHRQDTEFTAVLMGPPRPPISIAISGERLRDLRTDERSWKEMLAKVLSGGEYPGVSIRRVGLQNLVEEAAKRNDDILVLHEKGEPIESVKIQRDPLFVVGDHIGLAKKDEEFVLRHGRRISLGKQTYLAAGCIAAINYTLDRREVDA